MSPAISIDGRTIGPGFEPYVICELSGNHNGSLDRALSLIDAAVETGCDAIKLQTYTPDTLTIDCDRPEFRINGGPWGGRTLYDLYREAHTPFEWHEALFERATRRGTTIFSTPFDETAVALLEELGAPAYKIASFEAVDLALIAAVARTGKPMIISTGMADREEIAEAVQTARANGGGQIVLLHCVSAYPAPVEEANLATIEDLSRTFDCVGGLSDHTPGVAVAVAAVARGASVIEKHFTLARADGGPDAGFSLEPDEFARLVRECKDAWRSIGSPGYDLKGSEKGNVVFRRSLFIVRDVRAGQVLGPEHVRAIRPGFGLAPKHLPAVLGRTASRDLERGEALAWDMLE